MRVHIDPCVSPECSCEFPIAYEDCSNVYCDSCGGSIGGPRLFCLDCLVKDGLTFDTLDLCCAPESRCIEARVTYRENLEGPHEPYHRLVKLRTVVLTHHFGRTYKAAAAAFERVEEFCAKIAGASQQSQDSEEKGTGEDAQDASTSIPEPTTTETPSKSDKPDDVPTAPDGPRDGPEEEPSTTTEVPSKDDKSDVVPTVSDGTRDGPEGEPSVTTEEPSDKPNDVPAVAEGARDGPKGEPPVTTEEPAKDDKPDDVTAAADGPKDETKTEDEVPQSATQAEPQNGDLPTCGNCNGSLSFPFWHCIFCEGQSSLKGSGRAAQRLADFGHDRSVLLDNLFICDSCDSSGVVPDLTRSSGKHTQEHHLIRCMAPEKCDDDAPAAEQRLISIENRLDGMQTRFDELSGRIEDLTGRIGNIEQLLHKLAGTVTRSENGAAQS